MVPLFINQGDIIKVDTRDRSILNGEEITLDRNKKAG